jgi:LPXTG-motif cell wall-anchored protein
MVGRIRLAGLIAALLVILFPSLSLAQEVKVSVSPAVVEINDLPPGEVAQFELTIGNEDEIAHVFVFTTFQPPEEERTEGRDEFPDGNWISFSAPAMDVPARSQANVTVSVAIPGEQKWANRDWESWLGVFAESSNLLALKLYVRLLVSTGEARFNIGLVAGIFAGAILLGCGGYYYFRRRRRFE